jgi:predicted secreted protein
VILNISATERQDVAQDLLVATLSYSATGSDSRAIQSEINSTMAKALEAIKKVDTVKVETGSYQVYETTVPRTLEKIWQGSQLLTLKSKNADDLLALTGALQDMKLTMNGLNYTLDPKVAVKVQDDLMEAALKQLQTRADRAAKALKKSTAELREVQTQGMDVPYAPMMQNFSRMEVAQDQVAPPVAAAGETTITLTVSARAILKP